MNRSVLICEIREIRGKKLFCYQLWVAGETHAGLFVLLTVDFLSCHEDYQLALNRRWGGCGKKIGDRKMNLGAGVARNPIESVHG